MRRAHSSAGRPLKMPAHLARFLVIQAEVINVQMTSGVLLTLFVTKKFHHRHLTHISVVHLLTMPLRRVRIHALLVSLTNVPMDYFALQALRAVIRDPSSVVQPGKKQHLHVRCLAKVVRVLIVLTARNASVTRHALSLILFIVARALMKLLRRVQILVQVVLTRSVLEARHVTNIHHVAILRHRKRTFLMIRITVVSTSLTPLTGVICHVHQGQRQSVQLVKLVMPTPRVPEAILSFAEQRGMMLQASVSSHAPVV